ncbi:MAG TPA: TIGR03936 family radical SAM-associated protein [Halanaerobiales bacterium]|nr:TIGR03936 family radical SAM-associated protein [Halanaerobiales bacterium]
MKIRIEFSKLKGVRYISHLELMDTIRRAVRRANLPAEYTQGYNPHLVLALGQPLAVGMVGKGEFFDLSLKEKIDEKEVVVRLNESLPKYIRIKEAKYVPEKVKSLQAIVDTAIYSINFDYDKNKIDDEKILENLESKNEIEIIRKRRKKDDRRLDLRPMIYDIEIDKNYPVWYFTVSTGSSGNVRPSELIKALNERYESIKEVPLVNVIREGMFVKKGDKLLKPFASQVVRS